MGAASTQIATDLKHYGVLKTAQDVAVRALNRVIFFKTLKCVKIDVVNPEYLECAPNYQGLFLTEEMLRDFAEQPDYELTHVFLNEALAKGDECYGFLDGKVLAAYGWYSNKSTETDWPHLAVQFNQQHIYMYKGFTHPRHRGKRLHAVGMTRALEAYLARGYKGLVSYVEATNFASLKSCYRMGYEDFGKVYAARIFNTYFLHANSSCRPYGFRLVKTK
jgi:hypothetical protein